MGYQRRQQTEREQIEATVDAIGRGGKGLKIGDHWFSAFNTSQTKGVTVGDLVSFSYEISDKGGQTFRNIKGDVEILEKGEAPARQRPAPAAPQQRQGGGFTPKVFPIPADHPDRAIIRQNAANRAVELVTAAGLSPEDLDEAAEKAIELARVFEAYYAGEV